ncbi:hypothetical protein [Endozoicomonas numazuensis]|uniref:Uncharacterized protein n=1 Tax=Endozoicomonas numazuensis TaxID=1137799 RepID=A0A081NEC6_9GAMM|nr:hypothetical protein [Endozoicomonas numazuensis]KEQ16799.1 hypothetical protein GZ78_19175 [Endozoicomonas numazuensis]
MQSILFYLMTSSLIILNALLSGLVIFQFWGWFITPLSAGVIELPFVVAVGTALGLSHFTQSIRWDAEDKMGVADSDKSGIRLSFFEVWFEVAMRVATKPLLTLFIGWLLSFWV